MEHATIQELNWSSRQKKNSQMKRLLDAFALGNYVIFYLL